jgi:hypothetical protein
MSDQPTNLVLEILRGMRGSLDEMHGAMREVIQRLNRIEIGMASIRRDQGSDAEHVAHVEARLDSLATRVERIETRLELRDA